MSDHDLIALIGKLAQHFYGLPNKQLSSDKELRFGTHGSLSVDLEKGTWFDHEANEGGGTLDLIKRAKGFTDAKSCYEWMESEGYWENGHAKGNGKDGTLGEEVARYDYTDELGNFVFQVVRFEPKAFRQRRPDGNGGWIWNVQGVDRVLYRLGELIEAIANQHMLLLLRARRTLMRCGNSASPQPPAQWAPTNGSPTSTNTSLVLT
jgi:hypothetical protein